MLSKGVFLAVTVAVGALFAAFQMPAGWLLGSLLSGMVCTLWIKKIMLPDRLFKWTLAAIGGNIGFMLRPEQFLQYHSLLGPFVVTLVLTLCGGILLGKFLKRFSNVNHNTAFFCCMPGGASEVIALSKDYGADQRIVAAFHTTRITFFVFVIPLFVGLNVTGRTGLGTMFLPLDETLLALGALMAVVVLTIFLSKHVTFPGASLFFAIVLGFLVHTLFPQIILPGYVQGVAQGVMGAVIGARFDRETFGELKRMGFISAITLLLYFIMSLGLAGLFTWMTPLEWYMSLLSIVPAGAAEMASTATALQMEPAMVATLQMARVLALFLCLPFLIKWFSKQDNNGV
ncbi:AbrB family transcriptional regulator [Halalkalibacterium halodurans]|uniref:AbrB family transcriptional regulator n=1 Tax=Halalkalibacterium halodurans TaxID=86665 RepID=UPI002AA972D8|nr:AbrB family transcriptional regulator [Halalkalibacterium halodurans]MDY7224341.1 AbrB family transcriptional regulator [Halalkalibacterium halodurans]MDY7243626.1 AbrB family transcriptional regulator [Halalkalibacterium halodurans]